MKIISLLGSIRNHHHFQKNWSFRGNMIEEILKNVAIIGAAGKMGSGIALLLLQEMTCLAEKNKCYYSLHLIDTDDRGLPPLRQYLRSNIIKYAEKKINRLRDLYQDNSSLVSNEEIIRHFVSRSMEIIRTESSLEDARHAKLVFEAIVEDIPIKAKVYEKLNEICSPDTYYFTNTSSIPISVLTAESKINQRIIGFHFYNPPPVQKLLEIIAADNTPPLLVKIAADLAHRLNKIVVYSKDVAGFIGNGHLVPEILFACRKARELAASRPLHEAIYMVNRITQDYLIRPMGIFQLLDYVSIDVAQRIANIMRTFHKDDSLHDELIDQMIGLKIHGGQHHDGSQKSGFFNYSGHAIAGYYDFDQKKYISFEEGDWRSKCNHTLGELPPAHQPWKVLSKDKEKDDKIAHYLNELFNGSSQGEILAQEYLTKSFDIADHLVRDGIAANIADVTTVLKNGFYHLYGPDAPFLPAIKETMRSLQ